MTDEEITAALAKSTAFVEAGMRDGSIRRGLDATLSDADGMLATPFVLLLPATTGTHTVSNLSSEQIATLVMTLATTIAKQRLAALLPMLRDLTEDADDTPPTVRH